MSGGRQAASWVGNYREHGSSKFLRNDDTRRRFPEELYLPWFNGFIRPQVFTDGFHY